MAYGMVAILGAVLLAAGLSAGYAMQARAATSPVTVLLTFDDSNADQLPAEQEMKSLGLHGTFYTVSGWVNQPSYLTLPQVQQIAADGNEIAGHTIEHPDLPTLPTLAEQEREICNDRVYLINWGFKPTDFAYPFADADTNEQYAKACGYNSARGLGDVVDRRATATAASTPRRRRRRIRTTCAPRMRSSRRGRWPIWKQR